MNRMPGIMIRFGLILLLYGFFKNTTVDTSLGPIHNIGLMQQSQNMMIVGALLFIGGLLLKDKSKKERPEPSEGDTTDLMVRKQTPENLEPLVQIEQPVAEINNPSAERFDAFRDKFYLRLGVGFGAGLLVLDDFLFLPGAALVTTIVVFLMLSMRKIPSEMALKTTLLAAAIPTGILFIVSLLTTYDSWPALVSSIIGSFTPFFVLLAGYLKVKSLAKP
jgi:hypothetical protein